MSSSSLERGRISQPPTLPTLNLSPSLTTSSVPMTVEEFWTAFSDLQSTQPITHSIQLHQTLQEAAAAVLPPPAMGLQVVTSGGDQEPQTQQFASSQAPRLKGTRAGRPRSSKSISSRQRNIRPKSQQPLSGKLALMNRSRKELSTSTSKGQACIQLPKATPSFGPTTSRQSSSSNLPAQVAACATASQSLTGLLIPASSPQASASILPARSLQIDPLDYILDTFDKCIRPTLTFESSTHFSIHTHLYRKLLTDLTRQELPSFSIATLDDLYTVSVYIFNRAGHLI